MANSNFVVNAAQFTPLSFEEYYKPLAILNEQHQKLDDAYLELYTKASTVEQMANEQTDPEAYKQYKTYANDLRSAIETLNRNGLTPSSRSQMLTMARRYGDEVAPIQSAYTRRAADITAQREALLKDQTLRFSRKASDSSLMDYMKNPALSYESMSGAKITQDVADRIKNIKGQILSGAAGPWSKTLGGQQFERMVRTGLTPDDIYKIMANPGKYPGFTSLVMEAVAASGVNDWGSAEDRTYALQQAYKGLWDGIGTDKIETVENKDLDRAYKSMQIARLKDEMEHPEKYGHKSTKSGSKDEETAGRHYNEQGKYVSLLENERLRNRNSDLEFLTKLEGSSKSLKQKDKERLESIARAYGVDPKENEDGTYDYTNLKNAVTMLSSARSRPWYTSNLTDSSTLLSNIGDEITAAYNGEEVDDDAMDKMFKLSRGSWSKVKPKKTNGVEKSKMDIVTDILHDKNSRITLDPASGRLMIQPGSGEYKDQLGNIILYDINRDGYASPILNNQVFTLNINGQAVPYKFAASESEQQNGMHSIMHEIYDMTLKDYLYGNDRDYNTYYNMLLEMLFGGFVTANNSVTMSHGDSSANMNISIPLE